MFARTARTAIIAAGMTVLTLSLALATNDSTSDAEHRQIAPVIGTPCTSATLRQGVDAKAASPTAVMAVIDTRAHFLSVTGRQPSPVPHPVSCDNRR
jgi:hypothetical protein